MKAFIKVKVELWITFQQAQASSEIFHLCSEQEKRHRVSLSQSFLGIKQSTLKATEEMQAITHSTSEQTAKENPSYITSLRKGHIQLNHRLSYDPP